MQRQKHKTVSVIFFVFISCFMLVCFLSTGLLNCRAGQQPATPAVPDAMLYRKPVTGDFLVKKSFYYMRGTASISTVEMIVHRPEWERHMTINAWTRGDKNSIFFITAPPKDNGNGTLKKGRGMWIFNPKINRTIKLPPSMMSQSWMGSDFSNNDLSKTDSLLKDYTHRIVRTETENSLKIYTIDSTPKPDAPVIWGKLQLEIRQDFILLKEVYYDEDSKPVKILTTGDIQMMGNRLFPVMWKMQKAESVESDDSVNSKDKYTLLIYKKIKFVPDLPERLFTLSNLKNPGKRR